MKVKGRALLYFETGMEGCEWAVLDEKYKDNSNEKTFYDFLYILKEGDSLAIYENGNIKWQGVIKKDLETNLTDKTAYPYPRQVVGNYIVHWLQKGVNPDAWAEMFIRNMKCELERQ
jgi:antitoxin component YwqK of YwqJK toxin-antitoxin module